MKNILTIAGSDPTGFAGVQADLGVFSAMNARGLSAITAITVQNRSGVSDVSGIPAELVTAQIRALAESYRIDAVKTGMLSSAAIVKTLTGLLREGLSDIVVIDPVLSSTGDFRLLEEEGIVQLKKLLPFVTVITPNLKEASTLSGIEVSNLKGMKKAALRLASFGVKFVVVKGGHLGGRPIDTLYDGEGFYQFEGERLDAPEEFLHGTGCLFSSALATLLADGISITDAVGKAKKIVVKIIKDRLNAAGLNVTVP